MKRYILICSLFAFFGAGVLVGCSDTAETEEEQPQPDAGSADTAPEPAVVEVSYDFAQNPQGWEANFTDFEIGAEGQFQFEQRVRPLPDNTQIDDDTHAYYLKSKNAPGEVFLFLRRELGPDDGIEPDTEYIISYELTFATNYPKDCTDANKAYLKLGGYTWKPARKTNHSAERIEFNAQKGDGEIGGDNASVAGDIAHASSCDEVFDRYLAVERSHTHRKAIKSSPDGNIWLIVGVDSEMTDENRIYFMDISATLTEVLE